MEQNQNDLQTIKSNIVTSMLEKEKITKKDIQEKVEEQIPKELDEKGQKDFKKHMTRAVKNEIKNNTELASKYQEGFLSKAASIIKSAFTNRENRREKKIERNINKLKGQSR